MRDLKEMMKGKVRLLRVQDGNIWYALTCDGAPDDEAPFEFPVPMADTLGGTFLLEDESRFFMRWFRKEREKVLKQQAEVEEAKRAWEREQADAEAMEEAEIDALEAWKMEGVYDESVTGS